MSSSSGNCPLTGVVTLSLCLHCTIGIQNGCNMFTCVAAGTLRQVTCQLWQPTLAVTSNTNTAGWRPSRWPQAFQNV
jgi:hypothetical protein